MTRLPRDVSGQRVIAMLESVGYVVVRRRGSHVRLKVREPTPHAITIPDHAELRVGTLAGILQEVGTATGMAREELLLRLTR